MIFIPENEWYNFHTSIRGKCDGFPKMSIRLTAANR